jgi:cation diffusion facilitator CzcD-associated flavoprotein CzcO
MSALLERTPSVPSRHGDAPHVRVAIVGAGFAGLGLAIRLRREGHDDFVVLERAEEVGGTWRDNTYPGCQCDVPSRLYSLSFAPNPDWSRSFSRQGEIQAYLRRLARDHGLERHLRLGCEVSGSRWDDATGRWRVESSRGPLTADVLVSAAGGLSEPSIPPLPGLERFAGTMFHSARWEHEHDLEGERVAVVGTGASAIQFVPRIRRRVARMHVFQRTAPWILPATDRPIPAPERWAYRHVPALAKLARAGVFWSREAVILGMRRPDAMRALEALAFAQLRVQVRDRDLRARLRPDYRLGCKRILLSNHFYPALQRHNVELVTDAVAEVRPRSVVTRDGREREVDTIIFGTGFHVTDAPSSRQLRGREGRLLEDVWRGSPRAYRGTTVAGFPNLFLLVGPNTGTGSTSQVFMIEAQIAYVLDALRTMERERLARVEVRPQAQDAYNDRVQERMEGTVWTAGGCSSWYLDATGRNTTLWPDASFRFRLGLRRFDVQAYATAPAIAEPARTVEVAA